MDKPHVLYEVRPFYRKSFDWFTSAKILILKKIVADTVYTSPIMVFSADEMGIAFPFWILYFPVIFLIENLSSNQSTS